MTTAKRPGLSRHLGRRFAWCLFLAQLTLSAPISGAAQPTTRPLVGAYYYLWNPQNLTTGTLRGHLVPPQVPPGSLVNSQSPSAAARDIRNARTAGINFFAMDWWPYDPGYSARDYREADDHLNDFLKAPNIKEMKFAIFYETWNLGFDPGRESTPVNLQMELHFDSDMIRFAQQYFKNPSYLRIDGRPVVFLYLTRTLTGDVAAMIRGARSVLAARGFNPYFIGDEVYWRVTPETMSPGGPILTTAPQASRIKLFDAVTSYIMYFSDPDHPTLGPTRDSTGYPGETNIVTDQRLLLAQYRAATDNHVPVIPDVSPGFNDRGYRLPTDHPAEPRQWLPGEGPASTLDHFLRCVAIPSVDPKLPMVMVTSWDDWNEDTGIEPIPGTPTHEDDSSSGDAYTQGYTYGGEKDSAGRVLRRDVALLNRVASGTLSSRDRRDLSNGC